MWLFIAAVQYIVQRTGWKQTHVQRTGCKQTHVLALHRIHVYYRIDTCKLSNAQRHEERAGLALGPSDKNRGAGVEGRRAQ